MYANSVHATSASLFTFLIVNFFDQIVSNLPVNANEVGGFLKTFKTKVFFEKINGFSEKKLSFIKIVKGGKFALKCVSIGNISLKCTFRPNYGGFLAKNQKILNVGKIGKHEDSVFFEKKNVSVILKAFFNKTGKRKIAGRLVEWKLEP